jgi:hypothetical protein
MNTNELIGLQEQQKKIEEAWRNMLDEKLKQDKLFVQRSKMGKSPIYQTNASLRWINNNVLLFTELPLFKTKLDKKGHFVIDEEIVSELAQRAPRWDRQPALTHYLLRHKNRMFPSIVCIVSQPWVEDADAPEWDENGRATVSSIPIENLDSMGRIALVDFREGVYIYVIDGQHRLLGVKGVFELFQNGKLLYKKANGDPIANKFDTLEDIEKKYRIDHSALARLIDEEQIGIQFIPAVLKGETHEEARIRTRSIFVHINKTAVTPTPGEQVLLDEEDGFAIISRKVGLSHKLFIRENAGDRINWRNTSLPVGSHWITTGSTIRDMSELLLGQTYPFSGWEGHNKKEIAMRPDDDELAQGRQQLEDFLTRLCDLPIIKSFLSGTDIDMLREFTDQYKKRKKDKTVGEPQGHFLLRPSNQLILADAIGRICYDIDPNIGEPLMSLDKAFEKLIKMDEAGVFSKVFESSSVWYGITYNFSQKKMILTSRATGSKLLRYLLGALPNPEEQKQLLNEFRRARTVIDENENEKAVNFKGETVSPSEIQLPTPF